jgi:hypothetical protein
MNFKMVIFRILLSLFFAVLLAFPLASQDTLFYRSGRIQITDILTETNGKPSTVKEIRSGKVVSTAVDLEDLLFVKTSSVLIFPAEGAQISKKQPFRVINSDLRTEAEKYGRWNPLTGKIKLSKKDSIIPKDFLTKGLSSLTLIDRYPIKAIFVDTAEGFLYYRLPGTLKMSEIELDKVYSVRNFLGEDKVIYTPDTLENNWLTAGEMKFYLNGQYDAMRHYRKRPVLTGFIGVLFGGLSAGAGMFYGPIGVIGYTGVVGYALPSNSKRNGFNPDMVGNEAYTEGFGTAAKRRSVKSAALWSSIGYVGGLAILTSILK